MVDRTRELEMSLGAGVKKIEGNEKENSRIAASLDSYRRGSAGGSDTELRQHCDLAPLP